MIGGFVQRTTVNENRNDLRADKPFLREICHHPIRRRIPFRQDERLPFFRRRKRRMNRNVFRSVRPDQFPDGVGEFKTVEPLDEIDGVTADVLVMRKPVAPVDPDLMLLPQVFLTFAYSRLPVGCEKRHEVGVVCSLNLLLCVIVHVPPLVYDLPRKGIVPRRAFCFSVPFAPDAVPAPFSAASHRSRRFLCPAVLAMSYHTQPVVRLSMNTFSFCAREIIASLLQSVNR